ncbi:manganese efflux pump MntP family protein [Alloscardovia omnicolens]|uniref:manganese efflux pump MntP n=1 Tax=Alloscardovia omnicolens TaxID=419015 RepID=UPI003A763332
MTYMASMATASLGALLLAITLSVDALSVSMSIGARMHGILKPCHYRVSIAWFSTVHIALYSAGFLLGDSLSRFMNGVGPWVSFSLLVIIGAVMIRSAFARYQEEQQLSSVPPLTWKTLAPLAFACSVDASAVGSSIGLSGSLPYGLTVVMIGLVTAAAVVVGLLAGNAAGEKWERKAQVAGGLVLILLALKAVI